MQTHVVDVHFVTPWLGILTAVVLTWSTPTHADTCVAWDAIPLHIDPTAARPLRWGQIKSLFR